MVSGLKLEKFELPCSISLCVEMPFLKLKDQRDLCLYLEVAPPRPFPLDSGINSSILAVSLG
jgi:hypothetical protein